MDPSSENADKLLEFELCRVAFHQNKPKNDDALYNIHVEYFINVYISVLARI